MILVVRRPFPGVDVILVFLVLILSLSIIFWCFRQVRLVSFFVSSLFVPDAEIEVSQSTEGGGRGPADALARLLCFRRGVVVVQDPEFGPRGERVAAAGHLGGRGARECREVRVVRVMGFLDCYFVSYI